MEGGAKKSLTSPLTVRTGYFTEAIKAFPPTRILMDRSIIKSSPIDFENVMLVSILEQQHQLKGDFQQQLAETEATKPAQGQHQNGRRLLLLNQQQQVP